jgi:hypothetical protein
VHKRVRQAADTRTADAASEPRSADPVTAVRDLQTLAGNGAVARLIGRRVLARDPPPPTLPVYDTTQTSQLGTAFTESLTAAIGASASGDVEELVKDVLRRVHALKGGFATDPAVEKQIASLADIKSTVSGATYDLATTGIALREALAGDDGVAYAPAFYVSQIGSVAGFYLAAPLGDPNALTKDQFTAKLDEIVQALGQRVTLLSLELDASVNHLVGLRSEVAMATKEDERKAKRAEVATAARRALLLDRAISAAQKTEDPKAPGPLTTVLASVSGTVAAIREKETSEEKTRKELGDQPTLLAPQMLPNAGAFDPVAGTAKAVEPEEALPEATAKASDVFVGSLASHLEEQQRVLSPDAARGTVVPTGDSLDDLKQAHSRYMAFVSQQAVDPVREEALRWYETLYEIYGYMGLQGGIGRAILMHTAEQLVAGGVAAPSLQFTSEISLSKRKTAVSGTAGAVDYDTAELFANTTEGVGRGAEATSRTEYAGKQSGHQAEQFQKALMDAGAGDVRGMNADLGLTDEQLVFAPHQIQGTWSYLVRSENPLTGQKIAEQKQMPMEVANLILERSQAFAALRGTHTTGGLGEAGTRAGGVEGTKGTVREQYLQGKEPAPDATHPGLKSVQEAQARAAKAPNARMSAGTEATASVLADLEHYLDGWFANSHGVVPRISGVLAIANREYNVADLVAHELTGAKLAIGVAKALAFAAAIQIAGLFGPIGRAIGEAVGKVMHHLGAPDAAIVLTIAGWIHAAGEVESLSSARAQAYMVQHVATDMVQLFENTAGNAAVAGMNVGWTSLLGQKKPNTVGDLLDELGPVLDKPEAKKEFQDTIEAEIHTREEAAKQSGDYDPELVPLRAMRDALNGKKEAESVPLESVAPQPGAAPGAGPQPVGGGPKGPGGTAPPTAAPAIDQVVADAHASRSGREALLDRYGSWEETIGRLKAGAGELGSVAEPTRKQLIDALVKQRSDLIAELRGMYQAQEMEGASAEPLSDVDLNMTGPEAGRNAAEAMTYLDAVHPGWRTRYRMGILVDATRAESLSEALGKLPEADRLDLTRRQAMAAEAFLVAREARNAETDAKRKELLAGIKDPALHKRAEWLASLDESAANAERQKLLAHSDTALRAIDPWASAADRKAQIGEALDTQALANALDSEAYVTSGGIRSVVLGKKVDVTGRYEAVIDQIDMLHHQAHEAGGMRPALRKYETFKYVMRICDQLTAAGIKDERIAFLRNQGELVYRTDRSAVASDQPHDVTPGGTGGKSSVVYEDYGEVPGVSDAFLAETHAMLEGLLHDHMGLLRKQALGPDADVHDTPVMLPELGPPEPAQVHPKSSGPGQPPAPDAGTFHKAGLTDPNAVVRISDALAKQSLPTGASVKVHADTALVPMAAELAAIGTKAPVVEMQQIDDPERWGWFDPVRNVIVINEKAGMPPTGKRPAFDLTDPVGRQRLANLLFHECRHAQQYYDAMRYAQLENLPAVGADRIHPDIVKAAHDNPIKRGTPEADFGKRSYDEFYGDKNPQMQVGQDFERRRELRDAIEKLEAARARARVELQRVPWHQIKDRRLRGQGIAAMQRDLVGFQTELDDSMNAYQTLFHERDAYTAQAHLEQAMKEAPMREKHRKVEETLRALERARAGLPEELAKALEDAAAAQRAQWEALDELEGIGALPGEPKKPKP